MPYIFNQRKQHLSTTYPSLFPSDPKSRVETSFQTYYFKPYDGKQFDPPPRPQQFARPPRPWPEIDFINRSRPAPKVSQAPLRNLYKEKVQYPKNAPVSLSVEDIRTRDFLRSAEKTSREAALLKESSSQNPPPSPTASILSALQLKEKQKQLALYSESDISTKLHAYTTTHLSHLTSTLSNTLTALTNLRQEPAPQRRDLLPLDILISALLLTTILPPLSLLFSSLPPLWNATMALCHFLQPLTIYAEAASLFGVMLYLCVWLTSVVWRWYGEDVVELIGAIVAGVWGWVVRLRSSSPLVWRVVELVECVIETALGVPCLLARFLRFVCRWEGYGYCVEVMVDAVGWFVDRVSAHGLVHVVPNSCAAVVRRKMV